MRYRRYHPSPLHLHTPSTDRHTNHTFIHEHYWIIKQLMRNASWRPGTCPSALTWRHWVEPSWALRVNAYAFQLSISILESSWSQAYAKETRGTCPLRARVKFSMALHMECVIVFKLAQVSILLWQLSSSTTWVHPKQPKLNKNIWLRELHPKRRWGSLQRSPKPRPPTGWEGLTAPPKNHSRLGLWPQFSVMCSSDFGPSGLVNFLPLN